MNTTVAFIILVVYIVINAIVFAMYAWDKYKAVKGKWRTTEKSLIVASLFGPWGAISGMRTAHHKTQKMKFKVVYAFAVLHLIIIVLLIQYGIL